MTNTERILNGNLVPNHYPFFWLSGTETVDDVVRALERVKSYGCCGVTVEPRGFKEWETTWWVLTDAIVKRAKELDMKVLFVDEDSHCPTGHVLDKLNLPENVHLRRHSLVEEHVDVIGPRDITFVLGYTMQFSRLAYEDQLVGIYAYKRTDSDNGVDMNSAIDLSDCVKDGIVSCHIPEGNYRIIRTYKSVRHSMIFKDDFIDMLNADSVDLLIEHIYGRYEKRYKEYFNNTIIGFFSDEPAIGNAY